jgi:radical SAM superfamily enzyme YgiQ (UPF0313 family)
MHVTFVGVGCEQLPISLLAAICRREGHSVGLAFSAALFDDRYQLRVPALAQLFDDRSAVIDAIVEQQPDVLACSVLTNLHPWMREVAREAKERVPGLQVVFGGVHPSAVPDRVLACPEVDFVCVGEGDIAFPALLRALEKGGPTEAIPNIRYQRTDGTVVRGPQAAFVQDLDALPWFDKQLWEDHVRVGDLYITMASRGCPYRCTFCFNSFFAKLPDGPRGKFVRQRSVDHMIGELVAAKRRYRIRFVDFEDDIFTVNRKWLKPFLERYKREVGVPFQCLTHPQHMDDERAKWLADAGCTWTQMGIQSVDEEYKSQTLQRRESGDHVERAMTALHKHGIKLKADHIFGLPGEPKTAQHQARTLYAGQTPTRIDTFWATFFPGTEMMAAARESGALSDADVQRIEEGHPHGYHLQGHVRDEERAMYQAHELLFRMMPLLPPKLRPRVDPAWFENLPAPLSYGAGMTADIVNGMVNFSPDHLAFALHYLTGMARHGMRKLGRRAPPAAQVYGPPMGDGPTRAPSVDLDCDHPQHRVA